jgi:heat shock protein HslJ
MFNDWRVNLRRPSVAILAAGLVSGAALLAGSGGCASSRGDGASASHAVSSMSSLVGWWQPIAVLGKPVADLAFVDGRRPFMEVREDGGLGGFTGVNRFAGQLDASALAQGRFATGPIAMTKMAGPPELMQFEARFSEALSAANRATRVGDTLRLFHDGREVMVLVTQPVPR